MAQIPSDIQESLTKLFQLYLENEEFLLHLLAMVMIVLSGIVYVILLYTPATYGRYSNSTNRFYNIGVPAKTAWFFQEAIEAEEYTSTLHTAVVSPSPRMVSVCLLSLEAGLFLNRINT